MIFIDTNVPMYMVGGPHPNKDRTRTLIRQLRADGEEFVTDVEVYQEILHRYSSTDRLHDVGDAFDALDSIIDDEPISFDMSDIHSARELLHSVDGISARDAIHIAVMQREGITRILSFDQDLDNCPGIERIS